MCEAVRKFRIMQMGFTVFVSQGNESFSAYPFNVYLFPCGQESGQESGQDVTMDINTVNFHKSNHFDFNTWIYEGLSSSGSDDDPEVLSRSSPKTASEGSDSDNDYIDHDILKKGEGKISIEKSEGLSHGGAAQLFRMLKDFKVPIIGHNILIDLMFMYSEFCGPLPESLPSFKKEIRRIFPM